MTTRIPLVPADEQVAEVADLLGSTAGDGALFADHARHPPLNVLATLARHPQLYRLTVALAQYLTNGLLPARDRELVVLRTAMHCQSRYEWAHHCLIARHSGVSDEQITQLANGITGSWTAHEQALLAAADELHEGSTITADTWHVLCMTYGERELIELVMLVGEYHKVAFFLNSMGTPVDRWVTDVPAFPSKTAEADLEMSP